VRRSGRAIANVANSCRVPHRAARRASVSEQRFAPAWRRDCGGRGRGHEVLDNRDESLGVFAVGVVPDAFEDFEPAAGNRRVSRVRLVRWEDVVVSSPHDERRDIACEVEPVPDITELRARPYTETEQRANDRRARVAGPSVASQRDQVLGTRQRQGASNRFTSSPRPPLDTNTSRSQRSGNW
jgi:hypothetical protein